MATIFKRKSNPANNTASGPSGLAGFNLQDLADEGRGRLERVEQQADQLLADARAEAERIRAEAAEEGYRAGLLKAEQDSESRIRAAAEQRSESGLNLVQSALDQIRHEYQSWMHEFSESLNTIAIAASERIVCHELSLDQQLIIQWAKQAVQSTRATCELTVAVHPETLALLGSSLDEMLSAPGLPEAIQIQPDASLRPTEVVIRKSGGEIHAGLIAQLRRLEEVLS